MDIETSFLEGDLEEEIYIRLPKGLEHIQDAPNGYVGRLNKSVYGLVQESRKFYRKMGEFLMSIGFERSLIGPCLFKTAEVFILLYVDDHLLAGNKNSLVKVIKQFKARFETRVSFDVNKFLGVELSWKDNNKSFIMHQSYIIDRLEETFSDKIIKHKNTATPAPAMAKIKLDKGDEVLLSQDLQKRFMTGVGTLLYLVKYSRPDIANAVRELSKGMLRASESDYKLLMRVIKFVSKTSTLGIEYKPVQNPVTWKFISYVDSDWGGDTDSRKSVSGWCIFVNDGLVGWGSRSQKNVTLASTEAEYVGISEVEKEILFIKKVLEFLGLKIHFPIIIYVDNMGAIYLADGQSGKRTKHIDIRYHFVREYVEDGILKIIVIRSEKNMADPFTKNVSQVIFERSYVPYMKFLPQA